MGKSNPLGLPNPAGDIPRAMLPWYPNLTPGRHRNVEYRKAPDTDYALRKNRIPISKSWNCMRFWLGFPIGLGDPSGLWRVVLAGWYTLVGWVGLKDWVSLAEWVRAA